ncbi:MAG: hypothetical protein P8Q97_14515 [Myxococcota bacterium]|nr:hypothetical protein [Myxococcota bacterium]
MRLTRSWGARCARPLGVARPVVFGLAWFVGLCLWGPVPARSADTVQDFSITGETVEEPSRGEAPAEAVPGLGLDSLLKLPSSWSGEEERRQGMTSSQWRARFAELANEREETEASLAEARGELDGMSSDGGGQWKMGAPGSNNTEVSPMSFKHREQIRDGKEKLQQLRLRQRDLSIEADIAGVPESWRRPEASR